MNVTMLIGLPAAGKTAWVRHHASGALVVSSDRIRERWRDAGLPFQDPESRRKAHEQALQMGLDAIRDGRDVVVEDGRARSRRLAYLAAARDYGARTHIVFFENFEQSYRRNEERPQPVPYRPAWGELLEEMEATRVAVLTEGHDSIQFIRAYELLSPDYGGVHTARGREAIGAR